MTLRSPSSGASQRLLGIPVWTDTPLKSARMEVSPALLLTRCWLLAWAPTGVRVLIHLNALHVKNIQVWFIYLFISFWSQMWLIAAPPCCSVISMFVYTESFNSKTLKNLLNCSLMWVSQYRLQLFLKCHCWSCIMSYLTSPYMERGISGADGLLRRSGCF